MTEDRSEGLRVAAQVRLAAFTLHADFTVPPGLTVLFGPSGAGKSVTLQVVAGLVPLAAGCVTLGGRVLADMAKGLALPPRLRRVGYVPQHYALFPHLTVAQNIAYALPAPRHPWDADGMARRARRVAELLALVRLEGFENRWPRQLSGGQQQRVALARALAADPEALLLDEPLGALDAPTRAAVQDDLRAVVLASGVPAIVVTHDLAEARALADRLVVLAEGHVVAHGPIAEVLATPPTAETALLLGWRNVLPVAAIVSVPGMGDAGEWRRVELTCGQILNIRAPSQSISRVTSGPISPAGEQGHDVRAAGVALHADRVELAPLMNSVQPCVGTHLTGTLRAAADGGAFYAVRVALDGAEPEHPELTVTCSPREWNALGLAPGDRVVVRAPEGAARLVAAPSNRGAR